MERAGLRSPRLLHSQLSWALVWGVLAFCLVLDSFGLWTLASSPCFGARFRAAGNSVVLTDIEANGPLAFYGLQPGDTVLSVNGRHADPAAFLEEPEDYTSWHNREIFWDWQRFIGTTAARGSVQIVFQHGMQTITARYPVGTVGWWSAWQRSAALRLIGWIFLLVPFLIWTKKKGECSLVLLIAGIGVFASLCTTAAYTSRDISLPASSFAELGIINYVMSLSAVITLHLGLIFPTNVSWLSRMPWMRALPWGLCALQLLLHYGGFVFLPPQILYILTSVSLLGFILTVLIRLMRATNPLLRSQLKWVALAGIGGFMPFILLSALPMVLGISAAPSNFTLLFSGLTPICLAFAVFRYRLLDVDRIFDWVLVHAVVVAGFSLFEVSFWSWLESRYGPPAAAMPLMIALSLLFVVFLYAPMRSWLFHILATLSGRAYPSLPDSVRKLLESAYAEGDPRKALEQALQWTLKPERLSWVAASEVNEELLERMSHVREGLLGYELGDVCPENMEATAWVPVQTGEGMAAIVMWPQGARGWTRKDLRIARTLGLLGEPLFKIQNMQHRHSKDTSALREQREELLREMHDGLGSQLFGASLLTQAPDEAQPFDLRKRLADANVALAEAQDTLRTGITILGSPPGAFGPALVALLLRGERVLNAAGILLEIKVDDEATSLQMESRILFNVLRAMQESLTNVARHSRGKNAHVRIAVRDSALTVLIEDDGAGFDMGSFGGGYGLDNIKRRMKIIDGHATITSAPKAGCRVALEVLLESKAR